MNPVSRIKPVWMDRGEGPNVMRRGRVEAAAWLWSPRVEEGKEAFVRFRLAFEWPGGLLRFSVSADQRFLLHLDRVPIARGPDSSPPENWAFATYALELAEGPHELNADVWWAHSLKAAVPGGHRATMASAPLARMSWKGGFIFASETPNHAALLDTGLAPWRCGLISGWAFEDVSGGTDICHTVGKSLVLDGNKFQRDPEWDPPIIVRQPVAGNPYGLTLPGWCLEPSLLPEQSMVSHRKTGGKIDPVAFLATAGTLEGQSVWRINSERGWSIVGRAPGNSEILSVDPVSNIPQGSHIAWLLDLKDYVTGYLQLEAVGDLEVDAIWAESLFEDASLSVKGNRDAVDGKWFSGFGDRFQFRGKSPCAAETHWWRAGRYLLIIAKNCGQCTAQILSLDILRTGYPLAEVGRFEGDPDLTRIFGICERGLRRSLHEGPCDSPFYEQQCYVADARVQLLMSGYIAADRVLGEWVIESIDRSRDRHGWTAMRFPSAERQESGTFAMQWVWLLHDHWQLYGDREFLIRMMPSVEALLRACGMRVGPDGLLGKVPGWPFIDWIESWDLGVPPGARERPNGSVNATYLLTLKLATQLAQASGRTSAGIAAEWRRVRKVLKLRFFKDGWLCENPEVGTPSVHAQILGLLAGAISKAEARATLLPWLRHGGLDLDASAPSLFFHHYLFEALHLLGEARLINTLLEPWRIMIQNGLLCTPEKQDPARSDCHAWSGHPAYHLLATIGGIRPAVPGFEEVIIRPAAHPIQPGTKMVVATRLGPIHLSCESDATRIELPKGMRGKIHLGKGWESIRPGQSIHRLL